MRKTLSALALTVLLAGCSTATPNEPASGTGALTETGAVLDTGTGSSVTAENIRTEGVNYGEATGYLAMPEGNGPFPAVILIHEWWGLNDNIKQYAEQFAGQGYAALAVDMYNGEVATEPADAQRLAGAVREDLDAAFNNLEAAVNYLRERPEVDDARMGSVGWCFGGGWSYQMAKNDLGVKASVMYYGQFAPEDDLEQMKAHIMGHFGENDESIPVDDVRAFQAKLQTLSGEHQIFIYPNEGHGFARELQSESARTAWDRTLGFLSEQL